MASKKISEFSTTEFSDDAYIPVVSGGATYKMSLAELLKKTIRVDKSSEIVLFDSKSSIQNNDIMMLEDSDNSNSKKKCTKAQFLYDVPQVSSGSADPSGAPAKKGLIYINTTTGDIFLSADTTGTGDWKAIYVAP
jgi:hypothetical protein